MSDEKLNYSFDTHILDGSFYEIRYPAHYSFLNEGGGETLGFFLRPPGTIGVLRFSTYTFQNEDIAKAAFEHGFTNMPSAMRIPVNGMECMFFVEAKNYGGNDHCFWTDNGGPMSMYFYSIRLEKYLFCFSYRLPAYMEDDGRFDAEHPLVMDAIGSLHVK